MQIFYKVPSPFGVRYRITSCGIFFFSNSSSRILTEPHCSFKTNTTRDSLKLFKRISNTMYLFMISAIVNDFSSIHRNEVEGVEVSMHTSIKSLVFSQKLKKTTKSYLKALSDYSSPVLKIFFFLYYTK